MGIEVLLADDHAVLRSGLRAVLEAEPGIRIVGETGNGTETLHFLQTRKVDVLILDITMPGGISGTRIAEEVVQSHPGTRIVVLTMHEDEFYVREMFKIGVHAYLLKKSGIDHLKAAVHAACRGERYLDPSLAGLLVSSFMNVPVKKATAAPEPLTPREREVCRLLAWGHTNAEVGKKLFISERTVETHRANIMNKLQLANRAELVRFAIDTGLLKIE